MPTGTGLPDQRRSRTAALLRSEYAARLLASDHPSCTESIPTLATSPDNDNLPVTEPTPAALAIEQLGKLANAGAPGERLVATVAEIVAEWQKSGADAEAMREGITTVLSDVDDGVVAAEQFTDEAEADQQRAAARRQVAALRALQEALAIMAERLG